MGKLDRSIISKYNKTREVWLKKPLCRAPFSNLYFSKNGDVLVCCFNRANPIGKYPEMSLKEIWEGAKLAEFKSLISSNKFPIGCDICENELKNENFMAVTARRMDSLRIKRKYPISLEFELDNTCNLECIMCEGIFSSSIRKNREEKSAIVSPYNEEFVDYITPFLKNAEIIRFGGGEPFLINLYYKIWDRFLEVNSKGTIFIQTNGTVINDRIRNYLKSGRFTLGISIDSMNQQVFESIRRNANFNQVMHNILECNSLIPQNEKYSRLLFSITLMRENWKDIPNVIKFAGEIGVQVGLNTVWTPVNHALFNLPSSGLLEILNYYKAIDLPNGNSWIYKYNQNVFVAIINQIENWIVVNSEKEKIEDEISSMNSYQLKQAILAKLILPKISPNIKNKLAEVLNEIVSYDDYQKYLISIYSTPVNVLIEKLENSTIEEIINLLKL